MDGATKQQRPRDFTVPELIQTVATLPSEGHVSIRIGRNADRTTNQKLAPAVTPPLVDSPTSSDGPRRTTRALPPAVTRRPHKKSRFGCLTCKARRIKCDEKQPQCRNCTSKSHLKCEWPPLQDGSPPLPIARVSPKQAPSTITQDFSVDDLQSLHHFLVYCPPHLPLGSAEVWKRAIPQLAHQKPPLMQAILGLGSTHATRVSSDPKATVRALQYRGTAIRGLNELVATANTWSPQDVDTVLATCYALLFQAAHLPDSLSEYLTLVRGCTILTEYVKKTKRSTAFDLSADRVKVVLLAKIEPLMVDCQYRDLTSEAEDACTEVMKVATQRTDIEYMYAIREILVSLNKRLAFGLIVDIDIYALWYHLGEAYMTVFTVPDSHVSRIMLSYLMAIRLLLHVVLPWRWWPETVIIMPPGQLVPDTIQVIEVCDSLVPENLQHLMDWPRQTIARVPDILKQAEPTEVLTFSRELQAHYMLTADRNAHVLLGDVMRLCTCLTGWFEGLLRYKVKIQELLEQSQGAKKHAQGTINPSEDSLREMHKRINVFQQRVDLETEFPSPAVAESFLRQNWA